MDKKSQNEILFQDIPEDWRIVSLGEAITIDKESLDPQDFPDEDFDYYSIPAYSEHGKPLIEYGENILSRKLIVQRGEILFGKLNPRVPKIWHVTLETNRRKIASTEFIPLQSRGGISFDKFIYFLAWSNFLLPKSQELVSGSTPSRQRVDVKSFLDVPIPLPPLPEQRAIAHVLSTVRQAIDATEGVIAAARELKRSMMKHLFTYGPVPVDQADKIKLRETPIAEIPENWGIEKLEDICEINSENRDPSVEQPEENFIYIDISSIDSETGRIVSPSKLLGEEAPSRARRVVHTNDVIISTVRPYLKSFAIIPEKYDNQICSTGFAVLTNKKLASSDYIYYICLSDIVGNQFLKRMKGANYPAINIGDVKETLIPVPKQEEQISLVEFLTVMDGKIRVELQRKQTLESLFESLLNHLLTGKVRVQH